MRLTDFEQVSLLSSAVEAKAGQVRQSQVQFRDHASSRDVQVRDNRWILEHLASLSSKHAGRRVGRGDEAGMAGLLTLQICMADHGSVEFLPSVGHTRGTVFVGLEPVAECHTRRGAGLDAMQATPNALPGGLKSRRLRTSRELSINICSKNRRFTSFVGRHEVAPRLQSIHTLLRHLVRCGGHS